jgi:hypothetical protein
MEGNLKAKTFWWILGLGILTLLAWIGLRAYRNHLRVEEEMGDYDHDTDPLTEIPIGGQNHSKMAAETASK